MKYEEVKEYLCSIENLKTKDVDKYNKKLIKEKADVSDLKTHALSDQLVHRTYFQVSLGELNNIEEQLEFIEENSELLQDWWHVDQLLQFIIKPVDFQFAFNKAKKYIIDEKTFVRRWGYVIFLSGLQKEPSYTKQILSLMKDDEEYYVRMAEAWVISEMAVFNIAEVIEFLDNTDIKYNIMGKAIQKICDSYRISKEDKDIAKSFRSKLKKN